MLKITTAVRAGIKQIVAASSDYDVSTVRIGRDGTVSARKDADKTLAGNDPIRYLVGRTDEMVHQDGTAQAGW